MNELELVLSQNCGHITSMSTLVILAVRGAQDKFQRETRAPTCKGWSRPSLTKFAKGEAVKKSVHDSTGSPRLVWRQTEIKKLSRSS
jgi:hypothetical protein